MTKVRWLQKIISGGQIGVDRAALDAALEHQFPVGGWCPEGRKASDGPIPTHYPLQELPGAGYRQRNRRNVRDSDATLIFYFDTLSGGTEQTLAFCLKEKKPYLLIDVEAVSPEKASEKLARFIDNHSIQVLNIAGPRKTEPGSLAEHTHQVISSLVSNLR